MPNYWLKIHGMRIILICRPKVTRLILLPLICITVITMSSCQAPPAPSTSTNAQPTGQPQLVSTIAALPSPTSLATPVASQIAESPVPTPGESGVAASPQAIMPTDVTVSTSTLAPADQEVQRWPPVQEPLISNELVIGTLAPEDGILNDGSLFDHYEFAGRPGEFVTLTLHSEAFDAFLVLIDPQRQILTTNDDADLKAGSDAQLVLPLPMTGTYQVWVNANGGGQGAYTLQMTVEDQREQRTELVSDQPVQGWLVPGDHVDSQGRYIDEWPFRMPDEPAVVWLTSNEFDTYLRVLMPDGKLLIEDDDVNFVATDGNSRVVLAPSQQAPAGTMLTLQVSLPSSAAVGGAYTLQVLPLPQSYTEQAVLKIRPFIIRGSDGTSGAQAQEQQIRDAVAQASAIWQRCGITVALADDGRINTVVIDPLREQLTVGANTWTPDETLLQYHPTHAPYQERVVTVYFARKIDGGERYGIAYPSTRYAPSRSGLVVISDDALTPPDLFGTTLAHELGHILGLEHPNDITGDGDPWNDTPVNLMGINADGDQLTPLQCITARGEPHYLHAQEGAALVPDAFRRVERTLLPGARITDALTTQNVGLDDGQFIEVFYIAGSKGDQIRLTLTSTDFDPVLLVDGPTEERVAFDDDGGDGRNAEVRLTLPETGDYTIGVTSAVKAVGSYELVFEADR